MNVTFALQQPCQLTQTSSASIARDSTSAWTRWLGFSLLLREWIRRLGRDFSTTCPVVLDRWWPWTTLSLPHAQQAHLAQPLHVQLPSTLPMNSASMGPKLSPSEAVSPKVFGGFQLVPATDGQFAFLIPNPAFASATTPVIPLYANASVPMSVNASPVPSISVPTVASPVQGMTSFAGVSQAVSPVGVSAGAESNEPVWRPW